MNITVVGSGYVGMANAVMLAQKHDVTILDIDKTKVDWINRGISTIEDNHISNLLREDKLSIKATLDKKMAYQFANWVIIATPTDYDETRDYFNTDTVEGCIRDAMEYHDNWDLSSTSIVVKSTIPIGFINEMQEKYDHNVIFSPEFLREGSAFKDCIEPERIVVGDKGFIGQMFVKLMQDCINTNPPVVMCDTKEAEAIKLFANNYLAMRVAYFNEIDTYAEFHKLNTKDIIDGVCYDTRIGEGYNNPSFGYGGYCFPKDTKQLLANYKKDRIPNRMIGSIVHSNAIRKDWIANQVLRTNPNVVGIYRMAMKSGSDNFRSSAIQGIIKRLSSQVKVVIYEPMCKDTEFLGCVVETNLNKFKALSDVVVTNRLDDDITDIQEKVYTRDIYGNN